jgi:membrane fusion protein
VLMAVATDRATAQGDAGVLVARSMEQRRAALVAERGLAEVQARQRAQALADRARSLEGEARQLEGEQESAARRIELAQKSLERYRELARSGFVSEVQVQQRQEELLDLTGRRGAAERNAIAVRRDLQGLRAEQAANENALRSQLAQFDRGIAGIEQEAAENTARRELVVAAPRAGTVSALVATPGQPVQADQTLATLVPAGPDGAPSPLEAHLFAPSRAMGFVAVGQEVWIRYAAYPYQAFGLQRGRVAALSRTPIAPKDLPAGQAVGAEPLYRVTVALESQAIRAGAAAHDLRAGMALEADAVQERRKVWQWVLEPVLAASGLGRAFAATAR